MDSLIQSLKSFELGESGIDDIINKLNNLSTENDEWEILVKNYSKLKYLKNMESQLIHSTELIKSLTTFMEKIDSINQHYLQEINWLIESDILEESKKIQLMLTESLNFNCPFKKLKYIIDAYDILIPIIEDFGLEKPNENIDDTQFLQTFKRRKIT
jgi:hypothetical protein